MGEHVRSPVPVVKESDDGARNERDSDEDGAEYSGTDVMDHHAPASSTNSRNYMLLLPTATTTTRQSATLSFA